jgi:hypothetical protein
MVKSTTDLMKSRFDSYVHMDRKPHCWLLRARPGNSMASVSGYANPIPGFHAVFVSVFIRDYCRTTQDNYPFISRLIIPEIGRRRMSMGDNSFHTQPGTLQKNIKMLIGRF